MFNISLFWYYISDTNLHISTRRISKLLGHKCRILKFNVIHTEKCKYHIYEAHCCINKEETEYIACRRQYKRLQFMILLCNM